MMGKMRQVISPLTGNGVINGGYTGNFRRSKKLISHVLSPAGERIDTSLDDFSRGEAAKIAKNLAAA